MGPHVKFVSCINGSFSKKKNKTENPSKDALGKTDKRLDSVSYTHLTLPTIYSV